MRLYVCFSPRSVRKRHSFCVTSTTETRVIAPIFGHSGVVELVTSSIRTPFFTRHLPRHSKRASALPERHTIRDENVPFGLNVTSVVLLSLLSPSCSTQLPTKISPVMTSGTTPITGEAKETISSSLSIRVVMRPNETELSDRRRERAWLRLKPF